MIQIEKIHIEEFRGIRDLRLSLDGESYVVLGPNGTGKSGVVDAIEFALTGNISRLSGPGTTGVSLAKHGPHVHRRHNSARAKVSLSVRDTASGQAAVLTRSVKTPSRFEVTPALPAVRKAVLEAARHPEITLTRREIIKYVVTTPGERSKQVQALLKLDRLGDIRLAFRGARSKTSTALRTVEKSKEQAQRSLDQLIGVPKVTPGEVLAAVNDRRAILGLSKLGKLSDKTKLARGIGKGDGAPSFNRDVALQDTNSIIAAITNPSICVASSYRLEESLSALDPDSTILQTIKVRDLVENGLALLKDEHCPLCDTAWTDRAMLQAQLANLLQRSQADAETLSAIIAAGESLSTDLLALASLVKPASAVADQVGDTIAAKILDEWATALRSASTRLGTIEGIITLRKTLTADPSLAPAGVLYALQALHAKALAAPDQTPTSDARSFLIIAQERWSALCSARAVERAAQSNDKLARSIYKHYCDALDQGLALPYQEVQERFGELYRKINSDDELGFKAALEPNKQQLNLLVDFYSLGMFPASAYHSEGHQDGMGICIYLALMEQNLGSNFRLAILDDVLTSVDVNHRRRFCTLLTTYFPHVQFIITTHDEVWARQMQMSRLVPKKRQIHFKKWTIEDGPSAREGDDFWDRIDAYLDADDVSAAAALLRRSLEGALAELANALGGLVPYKTSGDWTFGELMDAVHGRYKKLLKRAANTANSQNNDAARATVALAKKRLAATAADLNIEQWAINPAVHYNQWGHFSKEDFRPVVEAGRAFLALFRCSTCEGQIYLTRANGHVESLHCSCRDISFNLTRT